MDGTPTPTPTYRYRIKGQRLLSDTREPPEEVIRAASELNAADAYFDLHGQRPIARFERVRD